MLTAVNDNVERKDRIKAAALAAGEGVGFGWFICPNEGVPVRG